MACSGWVTGLIFLKFDKLQQVFNQPNVLNMILNVFNLLWLAIGYGDNKLSTNENHGCAHDTMT